MWKAKINAYKIQSDKLSKITEQLLIEKPITCIVNNDTVINSFSTPEFRDHLFYGYLISQYGPQQKFNDIEKDGYTMTLNQSMIKNVRKGDSHPVKISQVQAMMAAFQDKVLLYKETGIAESAAIVSKEDIRHFADDIDRLFAFYKVLSLANESDDWGDNCLIISGKICQRVLEPAIQCGIALIISRTGMTHSAYQLAEEHNITCIGFCRGKHFTVYTGKNLITDG